MTLADDTGLTVYSDADGDGEVDHVTTVRFDGSWDTWEHSEGPDAEPDGRHGKRAAGTPVGRGDSWAERAWECVDRGRWG